MAQESLFEDAYPHFTAEGNRMVAEHVVAELRRIIVGDPTDGSTAP